jgi:molybdopterin-guanine dinucleotide biosynthesis protein A
MGERATGIILAGGQSRRMGVDKAFVVFDGQRLIERVLGVLQQVCGEILIASSDTRPYAMLGARVIPDSIRDFGAIAGLHAALEGMDTDLGVVVAVDMPFLSAPLLRAMVAAAADWDAVVPALASQTARAGAGRGRAKDLGLYPVHAVYRRSCLPAIRAAIDRDDRRLGVFLSAVRVRYFTADEMRPHDPELRSLVNVNTPGDLRDLERGSA